MLSDDGKLFGVGLHFDTDEQDSEDAFAKHGQMSEAVVIKDQEMGRSRGCGFATFSNKDDTKEALQSVNGESLGGRQIRVDLAGRSVGGGGYRGGSGDGGYSRSGDSYGCRSDGRGYAGGSQDYYDNGGRSGGY